jgi:hypothetical protein
MPCRRVRSGSLLLRSAPATMFALLLGAGAATSAHARPCDAIQKSSGEFVVGKSFDGEVIQVIDGKTIRLVPVNQEADPKNWCDVELEMYGSERNFSASAAAESRKFLTDFILNHVVICMPHPSNIIREEGEMTRATIRRGDHVIASCNVDYPLGYLRQVFESARGSSHRLPKRP